jgi:antitoxin component HigA of HigAB toxin-antitoxin module
MQYYPDSATPAQILRALMEIKGWKQADLQAELAFSQSEVSRLLRGERGLTAKTQRLIDLYLEGLPADEQAAFRAQFQD